MDTSELLTPVKITVYEKDRRRLKQYAATHKLTLAEAFERFVPIDGEVTISQFGFVSSEGGDDLGHD